MHIALLIAFVVCGVLLMLLTVLLCLIPLMILDDLSPKDKL